MLRMTLKLQIVSNAKSLPFYHREGTEHIPGQ